MTELERRTVLKALKTAYCEMDTKTNSNKEYGAIEDAIRIVENLTIPIVVGSCSLKEGDKIKLPSGLKCEVIAVNAKVKDEYGHSYMLFDNEIE